MSRIAYVNGAYVPMSEACVHIDDRGYQFADGVYEGVSVRHGKLIDLEPHLDRLWRSLGELQMMAPMDRGPMRLVLKEVVRRNRIKDGFLYLQITRGVAPRDHPFPAQTPWPAMVVTAKRLNFDAVMDRAMTQGVAGSSQPDIRWGRCDVKSTSLLPNILAKQAAREAGAFEAVMVDRDGYVTEGSSTNIWMVTKDGTLVTRSTDDNILPGITRASVMKVARDLQMKVEERAFTLEEAKGAAEMFLTSSTSCAMPIVSLDGQKIGDGTPGPVAKRLVEAYKAFMDA
ncbi:D-amino-acid transaminase [Kordiimonas lacus]|uniref:Probable branched-chain-amino-acid aminotransferase n=1 Tax=Kordiimonas lacus TaxID=637679 RepID=A0A1G6XZ81_9PROT|nr:D-amino-acid transaminase [Kordiimonas lacus]SDD83469.1 D-alanine transaminase [Kordiimonas lacus]